MKIGKKNRFRRVHRAGLLYLAIILIMSVAPLSAEPETGSAELSGPLPSLRLNFAGDLMAHPPNFRMSDYSRIFSRLETILQNDDLSFINLEFVVDDRRPMAGYPRFNVHSPYVAAAIEAGFEVFAAANNHSNDYGRTGVIQTRNRLSLLRRIALNLDQPMYVSGLRRDRHEPMVIQSIHCRGWHIGFISVTGILNQYHSGADQVYLVPFWDDQANEDLRNLIRRERSGYDLLILAYHGGTEYELEPDEEKRRLFYSFMDAGVDILWGHHPHVLQPIEFYLRPGRGDGAVMHSLGNFVSSQPSNLGPEDHSRRRAYTGDSALVELEVVMEETGPRVRSITPLPITHLRHFENPQTADGSPRDGFEVHLTGEAPLIASEPWKAFYEQRLRAMSALIGPVSARYYERTHPMP